MIRVSRPCQYDSIEVEEEIGPYSDPAGEPGLRAAVADYLAHARGLRCSPDDLIITNGATQGFALVAQALLTLGMIVAFEELGYPLARQVFEQHAARLLLVPVEQLHLVSGE